MSPVQQRDRKLSAVLADWCELLVVLGRRHCREWQCCLQVSAERLLLGVCAGKHNFFVLEVGFNINLYNIFVLIE